MPLYETSILQQGLATTSSSVATSWRQAAPRRLPILVNRATTTVLSTVAAFCPQRLELLMLLPASGQGLLSGGHHLREPPRIAVERLWLLLWKAIAASVREEFATSSLNGDPGQPVPESSTKVASSASEIRPSTGTETAGVSPVSNFEVSKRVGEELMEGCFEQISPCRCVGYSHAATQECCNPFGVTPRTWEKDNGVAPARGGIDKVEDLVDARRKDPSSSYND